MNNTPALAAKIDECLKQVRYQYAPNVRKDALQVCSTLPSLTPQIGALQYDGSKQVYLLQLVGTIPMYYQGSKYNIPMHIWFVEMYPYHPPLAYVVPTANMAIQPQHKHVDSSGRCYLPYLSQWNPSNSNIYELVNHLSTIFGTYPPVYQKPATTAPQQPPQPVYQPQPTPQPQPTYQPYPQQPPQPVYGQQPPYPSMMTGSMTMTPAMPQQNQIEIQRQQLISKLNAQVKGKVMQVHIDTEKKIQEYSDMQDKLKQRDKELDVHDNRLTKLIIELDKKSEDVKQQDASLQQYIAENASKEIDVDKAIATDNVHSAQILDCLAEIDAIEDIMYVLDKLFKFKKIPLDMYLRYTRELAKEQFMKKALRRKILQQGKQ